MRGGAKRAGSTVVAAMLAAAAAYVVTAFALPLSISEDIAMSFGTLGITSGGGTVTINTAGSRSGPVGFVYSGFADAARFTATGDPFAAVSVSFGSGTLTGPGASMTLTGFTHDAPDALDSGGSMTFNVGADLIIGAFQASGAYSGSFTVTVIYN